ncbi:UPF0262 family protein [Agrobacterium vitis]|uniref:UPF0262 family protein n=1 Tax=Agrobacterium vitis TaxID=373 RepID=UPI001571D264|nr:UPF0262 family protein [Agrobacterium vitis]NSY14910.1 UPF0262 family protein [Agrobacterium vitis]NSY24667.1 UPF0262 family protein [Agrobacterium vitis]WEO75291.1 UPF0262 family protein [Agrobacterium vitis]
MTETLNRLCAVQVEHDGTRANRGVVIEQAAAIADLVEESYFELVDRESGPYCLVISTRGGRLTFHVSDARGTPIVSHFMSAGPLRRAIRDYVAMCEVHYEAAANGDARRLETLDMGRRATHDEASQLLRERLGSKVRIDLGTARRLFTIIAAAQLEKILI